MLITGQMNILSLSFGGQGFSPGMRHSGVPWLCLKSNHFSDSMFPGKSYITEIIQ